MLTATGGTGPLVLVGAPGAGKSTVARLLAARTGLPLTDTDADVAARLGRSVTDVFVELGEEVFRQVEEEVALAALGRPGLVALGGGAVASATVREALTGCDVVWLDVDVAHAARRSGLDVARPAQLGNVRGLFMRMLRERAALYGAVARRRVDTSGLTPDEVADAVLRGDA